MKLITSLPGYFLRQSEYVLYRRDGQATHQVKGRRPLESEIQRDYPEAFPWALTKVGCGLLDDGSLIIATSPQGPDKAPKYCLMRTGRPVSQGRRRYRLVAYPGYAEWCLYDGAHWARGDWAEGESGVASLLARFWLWVRLDTEAELECYLCPHPSLHIHSIAPIGDLAEEKGVLSGPGASVAMGLSRAFPLWQRPRLALFGHDAPRHGALVAALALALGLGINLSALCLHAQALSATKALTLREKRARGLALKLEGARSAQPSGLGGPLRCLSLLSRVLGPDQCLSQFDYAPDSLEFQVEGTSPLLNAQAQAALTARSSLSLCGIERPSSQRQAATQVYAKARYRLLPSVPQGAKR